MFNYIEENVKAIENPNNVNAFLSQKTDRGISLIANLVGGESIQLTKPMNFMTYPFEPIYYLSREKLGEFYCESFFKISDDTAVNGRNFVGFSYEPREKSKFTGIIAHFADGTSCDLYGIRNKCFEKEKAKLEGIAQQIADYNAKIQAEQARTDAIVSDFEKMFLSMPREEQDAFLRKYGFSLNEEITSQNEIEKQ